MPGDKKIINGSLSGTLVSKGVISGKLSSKSKLYGVPTIPTGGGGGTTNYEDLRNKPQINGVDLSGNKTSAELGIVSENTTAGWNSNPLYLPKRGEICVYTDYTTIVDDKGTLVSYPEIKVGDGNAYLIDLPFVGTAMRYAILNKLNDHENNQIIHITQDEREFWNNKLNYEASGETLILTRN